MKRFLTLTLILMVAVGFLAADNVVYTPQRHIASTEISTSSGLRGDLSRGKATLTERQEEIHYIQDFEDGWAGWTTVDRTFPVAMWHLNQFMAHGGEGYSWWMACPDIGGYVNTQYTYLDTPQIMVTAQNSTLTFNVNWAIEELGDYEVGGEFYNGWDGANVRISTNDGETWSVISGTPAYNSTSMFAFGRIHGEGPNVPGWGGSSNGWVNASFDLSDYIGQNVRIRFAFASDNAVDSQSHPELYSILVDNISLGDYTQDFDDNEAHGMTFGSKVMTGGNLWHIGEPLPPPPSPTHAAICQNEEGTYNMGLNNELISPPIQMPSGGDIRVDFSLAGSFLVNHEGNFPDCNYWGFQVSPDSGRTWYAMSNPYGDPDGSNYVYVDVPDNWASVVNSYQGLDGVISEYAGEVLMFKIFFRTNDDDPVGVGFMIDDFIVYHSEYLPAPTNLSATEEDGVVHLAWNPPGIGGEEGWIHWDSGQNADAVGLNVDPGEFGQFDVAARFFPGDLENYLGGYITSIKFFPNHTQNTTYSLRIWTGLNGGTVIHQQDVPAIGLQQGQYNEIELSQPVPIEIGEHYWIGYNVRHPSGAHPAGMDGGPAVVDRGDMIKLGANWQMLHQANPQINRNWNIQAYVENMEGDRVALGHTRFGPDGYNVYRSTISGDHYELIGSINDPDVTIYSDMHPVRGMVNYYVVRAVYDNSQSGPTNEAQAFVLTETATEYYYDSGTADAGYNVGNNNQMGVKFYNDIQDMVYLTHVKVYVYEKRTGAMIIMVRIADEDNMPGQLRAQFIRPAAQIQEGWNVIPMPPATPVTFNGENFFVILQEAANASSIGVDEGNTGSSYVRIGATPWQPFPNGNLLIRSIVDSQWLDIDNEDLPAIETLAVKNYPNPFNPETTIEFNLPQAGNVNLSIYNMRGQLVSTLVNDTLKEGAHSYVWNGRDSNGNNIASGIYFYRLETNKQAITRRMVLLK